MGVEQLKLPTPDFVASPSQEFINQGVSFILKHRQQQHSVYVHCKAGRTRSATIVACYLMKVSLVIPTTNKSKWLKYILLFKNLLLPYMYILLTHTMSLNLNLYTSWFFEQIKEAWAGKLVHQFYPNRVSVCSELVEININLLIKHAMCNLHNNVSYFKYIIYSELNFILYQCDFTYN